MKYWYLVVTLLALGLTSWRLEGQALQQAEPLNIFEALQAEGPDLGTVLVEQPESVRKLVGVVSGRLSSILGREGNMSLMMGYRIQIYNGNQPNSKRQVEERAATVRMLAPEYNTYTTYKAPFWRLVVGDFRSMAEARQARAELLRILPAWGRESYVVRDRIRVSSDEVEDTTIY